MQILILPLLLFSSSVPSAKPAEQCDAKPFAFGSKVAQKTAQAAKPVVSKPAPVKKTTATRPLPDCKVPPKK
jgi:hypothetical protein